MTREQAFREAVEVMGTALSSADYLAAKARVLALYADVETERDALRQLKAAYEVSEAKADEQYAALRAERQGEVYEATDIHNRHGIRVRVIKVPPQEFGVGDRVRVTKVEEAK